MMPLLQNVAAQVVYIYIVHVDVVVFVVLALRIIVGGEVAHEYVLAVAYIQVVQGPKDLVGSAVVEVI